MSRFALFLLIANSVLLSALTAAPVIGQKTKSIEDIYVSLSLKDNSITAVFEEIELKSGFDFVYNKEYFEEFTVELTSKRASLADILRDISRQSGLQFRRINDNIIVKKLVLAGKAVTEVIKAEQEFAVTGKVTDENGESLPGATVLEKGTANGTITDVNGQYSLNVTDGNAILVISFVGYGEEEIGIAGRSVVDVEMFPDITALQEIVVVGYGTQRKSDITGAIASLDETRLKNIPNQNVAQALQGSIAGVTITQTGAGATPSQNILIRGRSSLTASTNPLIVLDGIIFGGSLNDINPNDIESIEVLKDASSTAIYGSRAANGVILVTSKVGTAGKPKINYSAYYAIQDFTNIPDVMNGDEFFDFKYNREKRESNDTTDIFTDSELEIWRNGEGVDWLDLGLRNGYRMEHNLSISGSTEKTNYFISGGYLDVQGLAIKDDYSRITARFNIDTEVTDWLTVGTRTQLSSVDQSGIPPNFDNDQGLFRLNPLSTPFDSLGNVTVAPWPEDDFFQNPLQAQNIVDDDRSYRVITNNYLEVNFPFIDGLQYRLNTGFTYNVRDRETYRGRNTSLGFQRSGISQTFDQNNQDLLVENIINYNRSFGKHNFFTTLLYSYQEASTERNVVDADGFPNDLLQWFAINQASNVVVGYSQAFQETVLLSQMFRLNYNYDSRYLFTLTGRRDGYSGFGEDTKFGFFPSVALGWNLSRENFFKISQVDDLKLRVSYGEIGNQGVSPYRTIGRPGQFNNVTGNTTLPGFIPSVLGAPNLGWETSRTLNIGTDFSLFQSRVSGELNYFRTNTTDLLQNRIIPPSNGITRITQNVGELLNTGFEASIVTQNVRRNDFTWSTNANVSFLRNEIVSLLGTTDEEGNPVDDINNGWFIGESISVNRSFEWDGIWQVADSATAALYGSQPGFVRIRDVDGDTLLTDNDQVFQGQRDPQFTWGLTNTFTYKNWSLNVFVHGVHGVTRNNPFTFDEAATGAGTRRNVTVKEFWTPENPTNDFAANREDSNLMLGVGARDFQRADFIRIKDITLSYNAAQFIEGVDNLQIYFTGRNLFTITNWEGLDPELNNQRARPLEKQYVFGINLSF